MGRYMNPDLIADLFGSLCFYRNWCCFVCCVLFFFKLYYLAVKMLLFDNNFPSYIPKILDVINMYYETLECWGPFMEWIFFFPCLTILVWVYVCAFLCCFQKLHVQYFYVFHFICIWVGVVTRFGYYNSSLLCDCFLMTFTGTLILSSCY